MVLSIETVLPRSLPVASPPESASLDSQSPAETDLTRSLLDSAARGATSHRAQYRMKVNSFEVIRSLRICRHYVRSILDRLPIGRRKAVGVHDVRKVIPGNGIVALYEIYKIWWARNCCTYVTNTLPLSAGVDVEACR